MYSQTVLDHYRHPRNRGEIPNATAAVEATNPVCGDLLKLWVSVRDGRIVDARFKVEGCIPAVACGSWLTEMIMGRSPAELGGVSPAEIEAGMGGLPSASRHAAALAVTGLQQLLRKIA
ncbi:MAG TPA: iron-sulfur cluster assembly scaffold protein [Terriglobia bacterium]|nr:iron-sulfur cluster assembly scaffold protein [Terriglobia bacterium]